MFLFPRPMHLPPLATLAALERIACRGKCQAITRPIEKIRACCLYVYVYNIFEILPITSFYLMNEIFCTSKFIGT